MKMPHKRQSQEMEKKPFLTSSELLHDPCTLPLCEVTFLFLVKPGVKTSLLSLATKNPKSIYVLLTL